MDNQQGVMTRAALGREASIGDLYDARTDIFCGSSIFNKAIPEDTIKTQNVDNSTEVRLITSDTLTDKFSKLDVKGESSVSFLAGLLTLEGSGRYLEDQKESARTVKSSLLYNIQTKKENVNVCHDDLKKSFSVDAIENGGGGTHVVTGITWGANSIVSCYYENQENRDLKEIEESLSAQMNKLSLSLRGRGVKALIDFNKSDHNKNIQFAVKTFGDILPKNEELPTTVDGALQLMKKLPSLIKASNGGKGKPLIYRLIPLSVLQKYLKVSTRADMTLKTLEEATLTGVVQLFDQMTEAQQKLHDLHQDATEYKYCVTVEDLVKISSLKRDMAKEEISLRSKLSNMLTEVRSGKKDASDLEALVQEFKSSHVSPSNAKALLDSWGSLHEKIEMARVLVQNGVNYIGVGSSLDEEIIKDFESTAYILFFTEKSKSVNILRWNGNHQLFSQAMKKNDLNMRCYAVDCDIHPDLLPKDVSSCVQIIQAGMVISEDLLRDQEVDSKLALVQFNGRTIYSVPKPKNLVPLIIPCTGLNCNPTRDYKWICKKCSGMIEYGFDDHVYCSCGKTSVKFMEFMCTDPQHGPSFERHRKNDLNELIAKLEPFRELNILILGETGVGKSTWINGFINFLTYDTLEQAAGGDLCTLIPSTFTVCDSNFDEILVSTGADENEVHQTGESATQEARVYPFHVGNMNISLIDTPGIGDTRGIEQDKKNFQNILATLSHHDELHGICILLKPNNARLNVMFRFCIKELLTYLHRDASKNIIFCFTNSRGTFYRPGDTMPALKTLLNENKNVEIVVSPGTVYCFDSEAYRFLAAAKNIPPVEFPEDERENFSRSWEKSISETLRMLEHIKGLVPHPIQSTLNLNHARELVLKMVRPLAEISRNIQTNKAILEDEKKEIEKTKENIEELKKKQMTTRTEIEVRRLNYPKTVCSNSTCVKIWSVDNVKTTEYVTVCHDHCNLTGVKEDSIGDPALMKCWAMENGCCRHYNCGHHYREHLHIYYDSIQVVKKVEDQAVKESLRQNLSAAEMKQKMIAAKDEMIKEFEYELKEIEKASVTFAYFLKINAITPYNDGMEMYLNHLIREEEDKVCLGGVRKTLDSLVRSKASYLLEKTVLEEKMKMGTGAVPTKKEVDLLVMKLKGLKHSGQGLKDALDCVDYSRCMTYNEAVVKDPDSSMRDNGRQQHNSPWWKFRWARKRL